MPSRWLLTKFLHRSSVGSLLRVRCWLGIHTTAISPSRLFHFSSKDEGNKARTRVTVVLSCQVAAISVVQYSEILILMENLDSHATKPQFNKVLCTVASRFCDAFF